MLGTNSAAARATGPRAPTRAEEDRVKASLKFRDDTPTLLIEGELDALSVPNLRPVLEELLQRRPQKVAVDVSKLRLIDSSGVGLLISLFRRLKAQGGRMALRGAQEQPLFILRLMRLDHILMADDSSPSLSFHPNHPVA
jgi:anti-sigma B factor antagonist